MINKQLMMNNFNKAADDYLCYAQIQKDPALKIYSLIENKLNSDLNILDLGSGTGLIGISVAQRNPKASIDCIEIDENASCNGKVSVDVFGGG